MQYFTLQRLLLHIFSHLFFTTFLWGRSYLLKKFKHLKWFKITLKEVWVHENIKGSCLGLRKACQFPVLQEAGIRAANYLYLAFSYDIFMPDFVNILSTDIWTNSQPWQKKENKQRIPMFQFKIRNYLSWDTWSSFNHHVDEHIYMKSFTGVNS